MTKHTDSIDFALRRTTRATFNAEEITSDAGLLLLRALDDRLGLTKRLADRLGDPRTGRIVHSQRDLVRSRVFAIAQGYEDCNDFHRLREEPLFKAVCDRLGGDAPLASQPTLSRFENGLAVEALMAGRAALLDHYIERVKREGRAPSSLTLDLDFTDDPTHGQQELAFFHTHYGGYVYLQLFICTEDGDLLFATLLPTKWDVRSAAIGHLETVVSRLRAEWPQLALKVRADNGFATPALYDFCEREGIAYIVNAGSHVVLQRRAEALVQQAQADFAEQPDSGTVRRFGEFQYRAKSWSKPRRIIAKAQRTPIGPDLRFLVTNCEATPEAVYDDYAMRGQMENWIKDLKLGLRTDRLSCHRFRANMLRLLLHAVAYQLLHELRRSAEEPELRLARLDSLRLKLLRVAGLVEQTARKLWVRISRTYPHREAWLHLARGLVSTG